MKGKKTGGRKVGTPNATTKELRERINTFLDDNWHLIQSDFEALQPRERLNFYERLMSYRLHKPLPQTEVVENKPIGIREIVFIEPASNYMQKKEATV